MIVVTHDPKSPHTQPEYPFQRRQGCNWTSGSRHPRDAAEDLKLVPVEQT